MLDDDIPDVPVIAGAEQRGSREDSILDAAIKVFTSRGYDGARTKEIAKEAGVSEATIFKYFPTKQAIFAALAGTLIERVAKPLFLKPVAKLLRSVEGKSIREKMIAIALERTALFRQHGKYLGTMAVEAARHPEMLDVIGQKMLPALVAIFEQVFDTDKERGLIKDIDTRIIARTMLSLIGGNVLLSELYPDYFRLGTDEEEAAVIVDIVLDGLAKRKGGE